MRPVKYSVATSLDGFIAGPNGEIDWIQPDPALDFATIYAQFDTALLGRRTYELTQRPGAPPWPAGWNVYVISTTIRASADPAVHVINTDVAGTVARLRRQRGKAIWLFGGGVLFASLLAAGQVDELELAVMPVLLGRGVPLLHPGGPPVNLRLLTVRESSNGIVRLSYRVNDAAS
jgi:dihydrofolate reductase